MKSIHGLILMVAAAALGACAPVSAIAVSTITTYPPSTSMPAATRPSLEFPARVVITSSSLSLTVDDPSDALAELEVLVEDAGGLISSASSWSDPQTAYASMSAKVPPTALADLRRAAIGLSSGVQSNSTYSQDVTSEVQSLRQRLALVDESENRLLDILLTSSDASLAKSYVLIAQLFQQERQNAESQLQNYMDSSTLSSFDVTLNGQPTTLRLYPDGTPTPYLE